MVKINIAIGRNIYSGIATINNRRWSSDTDGLAAFLESMDYADQVKAHDPDPDFTMANLALNDWSKDGSIIEYIPLKSEQYDVAGNEIIY
jgi:hypothetical protein